MAEHLAHKFGPISGGAPVAPGASAGGLAPGVGSRYGSAGVGVGVGMGAMAGAGTSAGGMDEITTLVFKAFQDEGGALLVVLIVSAALIHSLSCLNVAL